MIADVRAATPSAAAEIVAGREEDIIRGLHANEEKMIRIMDYFVLESASYVKELTARMRESFVESYRSASDAFARVSGRLSPQALSAKVTSGDTRVSMLAHRQEAAMGRLVKAKHEALGLQMAKLNALSPLAVLTRGFSLTQTAGGNILRDASNAKPGDKLKVRLEKGKLNAEVLSVEE
jgi:exodeoxyribonuclease VII large subunit